MILNKDPGEIITLLIVLQYDNTVIMVSEVRAVLEKYKGQEGKVCYPQCS